MSHLRSLRSLEEIENALSESKSRSCVNLVDKSAENTSSLVEKLASSTKTSRNRTLLRTAKPLE